MRYLSNVSRNDKNEHRVYVATLRSGMNVKYIDCPMPNYERDSWYDRTLAAGDLNDLGCIASFETNRDHSKFWDEWHKIDDVETLDDMIDINAEPVSIGFVEAEKVDELLKSIA